MNPPIDLRSDTVTKPTPAMRRAMAEAEVGDDVYGEDPTVNRLEQRAAEITGKEAAVFVPTGTMGNTIGIKLHTEHGQEVICEARSHVLNYELAMMAWFSGCVARSIFSDNGVLRWEQISREIRPLGPHWAPTGLIEIENTHNMAGGTVYPLEVVREKKSGARALARMTGSMVVTLLRLGEKVPDEDAMRQVILDGQMRDGGYAKENTEKSDLESTYRVERAIVMLKLRPRQVEAMRSFVAKCRNEDGGYGLQPGAPSSAAATYFASIVLHWLNSKDSERNRR